MREQTMQDVLENRIVVIVRGVAREKLIPFAEAVYAGGIRLLEVTYDASGNVPDEETAQNIRMLCEHFRGKMRIGAGTVLKESQVVLTKEAGGEFIISPDTCREVIRKTRELELVSMPGAYTPTEIADADRLGADFVKVFPAGGLGAGYFKDVSAPLSNVKLLAVGGVDLKNMKEFSDAGAAGFGIGSAIVRKDLIAAADYRKITELAAEYVKEAHR